MCSNFEQDSVLAQRAVLTTQHRFTGVTCCLIWQALSADLRIENGNTVDCRFVSTVFALLNGPHFSVDVYPLRWL